MGRLPECPDRGLGDGEVAPVRSRGFGALLLVVGLLLGGYALGDLWGRVAAVAPAQAALDRALDARWTASPRRRAEAPVRAGPSAGTHRPPGTPIARLYLPSIGLRLVVVEGVGDAQLALGPGRIPGTADLGESGNIGLAAHRQPGLFWDLDQLRVGDAVIVETRDAWYFYRVDGGLVVRPTDSSVLATPPEPGASIVTLVTCEPKLSTARRLIRRASLVRREARTATIL